MQNIKIWEVGSIVFSSNAIFEFFLSFIAKREDEDYDEQVEEVLQDEVNVLINGSEKEQLAKMVVSKM